MLLTVLSIAAGVWLWMPLYWAGLAFFAGLAVYGVKNGQIPLDRDDE